jgi:hypothetical protein
MTELLTSCICKIVKTDSFKKKPALYLKGEAQGRSKEFLWDGPELKWAPPICYFFVGGGAN